MSMNRLAGAGFQLSERVILDLGYRFIDMGKAQSGTSDSSGFTNNPPVRVDDLTAHEFKVGLRFHFGG
jgi:opacity protein-like surface antigen